MKNLSPSDNLLVLLNCDYNFIHVLCFTDELEENITWLTWFIVGSANHQQLDWAKDGGITCDTRNASTNECKWTVSPSSQSILNTRNISLCSIIIHNTIIKYHFTISQIRCLRTYATCRLQVYLNILRSKREHKLIAEVSYSILAIQKFTVYQFIKYYTSMS